MSRYKFAELQSVLIYRNRNDILGSLLDLDRFRMNNDWKLMRAYQLMNLQNGINKVRIPDLLILQQVIDKKNKFIQFEQVFSIDKELFKI